MVARLFEMVFIESALRRAPHLLLSCYSYNFLCYISKGFLVTSTTNEIYFVCTYILLWYILRMNRRRILKFEETQQAPQQETKSFCFIMRSHPVHLRVFFIHPFFSITKDLEFKISFSINHDFWKSIVLILVAFVDLV